MRMISLPANLVERVCGDVMAIYFHNPWNSREAVQQNRFHDAQRILSALKDLP